MSGCELCNPEPPPPIVIEHTKKEYVYIPDDLIDMTPLPEVPKDVKLQSEVSKYSVELWNSADSCKSNMLKIYEFNKKKEF